MIKNIFLCSTFQDLRKERSSVLEVLRRLKLIYHAMEFFGARPHKSITVCLEEVSQSDILIVIVGSRYGNIIPKLGISYAEAEYKEGIKLGKPCLIYIRDRNTSVPLRYKEQDLKRAQLLSAWKASLRANHTVSIFKNHNDLAVNTAIDISRLILQSEIEVTSKNERQKALTMISVVGIEMEKIIDIIENRIQSINFKAPKVNTGELFSVITDIKKQCVCASHVFRTIKDFERASKEKETPININSLLEDTVVLFRNNINPKLINVKWSLNYTPPIIKGYLTEIRHVFLNIISNALQAMKSSGGELKISTKIDNGNVIICITDTGPGIMKQYLGAIFEPFFTTHKDRPGIGLTIAQKLVENHKGKIYVKSKTEKGTTFIISLPLIKDS